MNKKNLTTRREWFRLRTSPSEPSLGDSGAQSVAQPPNHDGMDLSQLPPMRESELDHVQIAQLFSDIGRLGSDISLMQRASDSRRAIAQPATDNTWQQLEIAQQKLLSGEIPRLQIRYRWDDQSWIDTLTQQEKGYRLVRIAHASVA